MSSASLTIKASDEATPPLTARQEEMLRLGRAHGETELTLDLDLVMSTMTEDVWWRFDNVGLVCRGQSAVREWYRRTLPALIPSIVDAKEGLLAFGESQVVMEHILDLRFPDGVVRPATFMTVLYFRGDKVSGERVFMGNEWARIHAEIMGADILDVPGCSYE